MTYAMSHVKKIFGTMAKLLKIKFGHCLALLCLDKQSVAGRMYFGELG